MPDNDEQVITGGEATASLPSTAPAVMTKPRKVGKYEKDSEQEKDPRPRNFDELENASEKNDRDRNERVLSLQPDVINDIVGANIYVFDCGRDSWRVNGSPFSVTRFYWTKKIAFDRITSAADEKMSDQKEAHLRSMGIAYFCVHQFESISEKALRERMRESIRRMTDAQANT